MKKGHFKIYNKLFIDGSQLALIYVVQFLFTIQLKGSLMSFVSIYTFKKLLKLF